MSLWAQKNLRALVPVMQLRYWRTWNSWKRVWMACEAGAQLRDPKIDDGNGKSWDFSMGKVISGCVSGRDNCHCQVWLSWCRHWIWAGRAAWKAMKAMKAMSYAAWYQLGFNGNMYFFTVGPGVTRFTCQAIVQKKWLAKLIFWYFAVNGRTSWRNPYANAHFLDTSTKICHVQWLYRLFI